MTNKRTPFYKKWYVNQAIFKYKRAKNSKVNEETMFKGRFSLFYQICQVDQAIFDLKWAEDSKINEKSMLSEYLSQFY